MISYIHAPLMALCFFILLSMWRFWVCIDRLGFTREVSRRAPSMVPGGAEMNLLDYIRTLASGDYIDMAHLIILSFGAWKILEGVLDMAADTVERLREVRK